MLACRKNFRLFFLLYLICCTFPAYLSLIFSRRTCFFFCTQFGELSWLAKACFSPCTLDFASVPNLSNFSSFPQPDFLQKHLLFSSVPNLLHFSYLSQLDFLQKASAFSSVPTYLTLCFSQKKSPLPYTQSLPKCCMKFLLLYLTLFSNSYRPILSDRHSQKSL